MTSFGPDLSFKTAAELLALPLDGSWTEAVSPQPAAPVEIPVQMAVR